MSFFELCICALVAFLVLGPKRLPVAARLLGRWCARAKRLLDTLREDIHSAQKDGTPRD